VSNVPHTRLWDAIVDRFMLFFEQRAPIYGFAKSAIEATVKMAGKIMRQ
jgi:hypothetical protein